MISTASHNQKKKIKKTYEKKIKAGKESHAQKIYPWGL